MKFAYYPGCSLHATAKEYDRSTRAVCAALGIELEELTDWTCCGATSAHASDRFLSVALPARNLTLSQATGLDLAVPCAACYQRLRVAELALAADPGLRAEVARAAGEPFAESANPGRVRSLLEIFSGTALKERIDAAMKHPLEGLSVACYYGCLLVRPPAVTGFDDPEQPHTMDDLLAACGATPVDWGYKTECCGASLALSNEAVVLKLTHDILRVARAAGAHCLAVACPLCQSNLDTRQGHVNRAFGENFALPVVYFTQVIGLALGLAPKELGLNTHFVETGPVLRALGR
ncbi:MAG: CoB--CoM heterodisulfide reductase iron-sulfur subunit B family protein [Thermoanaerobacterales bacterium]|nr:CoB--CoM heterodisulfide reductase iron-sulfur subunit B family protein [Bacillota bacterium]MDI6907786.1 CoB--CoM heterodisulfide reductase iron-sulfur subunit B family protein [Thermoanaerobacterales bacterium]